MKHFRKIGAWLALAAGSTLLSFGASAQVAEEGMAVAKTVRSVRACAAAERVGYANCHARIVVNDAGAIAVQAAPSGYGPSDLRDAYNVTSTGSGATVIAIVDAFHYPKAEADLAKYRAKFALPPCTKANGCLQQVDQNGGQSFGSVDTGWNQEAALDLDMASAICPSCKLVLVEGNTNSFADLATAVNTAATLPGVHVISNSYGGSEAGGSSAFEPSYDHLGIAVTVSSGDSGFGVQFPASSPHVIAVGGTTLNRASNARGWTETVWSGAGSGCSAVYAKPSWQADVGCARRTVADVSAVANPSTGVAVYGPTSSTKSGWLVFGGTSVAAPVIGGIYAVNGGPVTYGADPYSNTAALFDVISGKNGKCGGSYLCTGKPGYDGPTGLGTPNGVSAF